MHTGDTGFPWVRAPNGRHVTTAETSPLELACSLQEPGHRGFRYTSEPPWRESKNKDGETTMNPYGMSDPGIPLRAAGVELTSAPRRAG